MEPVGVSGRIYYRKLNQASGFNQAEMTFTHKEGAKPLAGGAGVSPESSSSPCSPPKEASYEGMLEAESLGGKGIAGLVIYFTSYLSCSR